MAVPDLDVSVIICAYTQDRLPALIEAVHSVQRQTHPAREIVAVIDGDSSLLRRAREALPGVTVIPSTCAPGLSGARNTGMAVARGAIVAFLDDDAIAAADWLAHLLEGYADRRVIAVGGAIEPLWAGCRPPWFPEEFGWVVGCSYRGMPRCAAPVRNLIGCNMSFRRDACVGAGGFRTDIGRVGALPLGCEETEYCIRLRRARPDGIILYHPQALVRHRVPSHRAGWRYFRDRCYAEGRSKALVARVVGAGSALAVERAYTLRILPRGVARSLVEAVRHRDTAGLAQAGAILAGLGVTACGYLGGRLGSAGR
jgi:GT2 family glycosyltransferase